MSFSRICLLEEQKIFSLWSALEQPEVYVCA